MNEKRPRIIDIAEELGLSTATVSNVIHGKTAKISDETVKRVQMLLEEKQYIPSMAGILLAQNHSGIIGIIIHNHQKYGNHALQDPFIISSIDHLSNEIEKAGFFMMVKTTDDCDEMIRFASMWNMEGLIIIGFCEEDYEKLRSQMHIPFVVYDGVLRNPGRYANISIDNFDGGYQMGQYLISQGHRRILCLADNDTFIDHERYLGLKKAGEENGAILVERLLVPIDKADRISYYESSLAYILNFTAIFAVSDQYAAELIKFLYEKGIHVPDRLSVAGFDDIPFSGLLCPGLTTIRQDGEERARTALRLLKELKNDTCTERNPVLPVTLVERESVRMNKNFL